MKPPGTSVAMPVTLPPGRARLATRPTRTGSATAMKTMGMVDVAFFAARLGCGVKATIRSGFRATSSCASAGKRSTCPSARENRCADCRPRPSRPGAAPRAALRRLGRLRSGLRRAHRCVPPCPSAARRRSATPRSGRRRSRQAGCTCLPRERLLTQAPRLRDAHASDGGGRRCGGGAPGRHGLHSPRSCALMGPIGFRSMRPVSRAAAPVCAHRNKSDCWHSAPIFSAGLAYLRRASMRAQRSTLAAVTTLRQGRSQRLCRSGLQLDELLCGQPLQAPEIGVADAQAFQLIHRLHQVFGARSPVADGAAQHARDLLAAQAADR